MESVEVEAIRGTEGKWVLVVDGHVVVQSRQLMTMDLAALREEITQAATHVRAAL